MPQNNARVTVVVPSYNHAPYLKKRMDSLLSQTYRDFSIVCIDDASTDESLTLLESYRSPRVEVVGRKENSGSPFVQWNAGVEQSDAEYIWIAESDDYSAPDFLEKCVSVLDQNASVGLVYCQSIAVDVHNNEIGPIHFADIEDASRWNVDYIESGRVEVIQYLSRRNTIPNASAVVFRRELYERIGGADQSMRLCGDWVTWIKIAIEADVAFLAKPMNFFRTAHANSCRFTSQLNFKAFQEYLNVANLLEENFETPSVKRNMTYFMCSAFIRDIVKTKSLLRFKSTLPIFALILQYNLKTFYFLPLAVLSMIRRYLGAHLHSNKSALK